MKLDQTLIEEQSKMSQKKAIVKATEGIRSDLQAIQKKVKDVNDILSKQDKIIEIINYVTGIVPQGMDVQNIDVKSEGATFNASTPEYRKIQSLQKRLQKEARFEKINVGGVVRDKQGVYTLNVSLEGWKGVVADVKPSEAPTPSIVVQ
jgi:molybdenum cofactor biosynthesis enzyme MoaA